MKFQAFIFPAARVAAFTRIIDQFNEVRPIKVQDGPDAGKFFLDKEIIQHFPQLADLQDAGSQASEKELDTDIINPRRP